MLDGWMVCGQVTLFHCSHAPQLTMVVSYVLTHPHKPTYLVSTHQFALLNYLHNSNQIQSFTY
jgi:hypothetical protein